MCLQSVIGVVISACMAGIVFAKLARPKSRTHTVKFSKNAVITHRNGHLWLLFRVGNLRRSHLIEAHLRAQLVHHKITTSEGENLTYESQELPLTTQTFDDDDEAEEEPAVEERTLLIFPTTVAHRIDKDSPFYALGPKEILSSKFELVVTLEGVVEPTGNSVQSRSSYLPNEILWAHRYENMVNYSKKRGVYLVDCSQLNAVAPDETPRISKKQIDDKKDLEKKRLETAFKKMDNTVSRVCVDNEGHSIVISTSEPASMTQEYK
jgi:potassium inwardly-rectifying channel subfamily J